MKIKPSFSWMIGLAVAGLLVVPAMSSSGQVRIVTDTTPLATGQGQTVVVTQRPLRTFRGQAVRVGRFAEAPRAIGVVRPLREVPRFDRGRAFRSQDRFGRSVGFFDDFGPRFEEEIGVVRPFVTFDPPVRNPPKTYTNPRATASPVAASSSTQREPSPTRTVLGQDVNVVAVTAVEVPEAHSDDPWALLNAGYYREARQQFALLGAVDDTVARTGHALAAALSGDLAGGIALMPADPALPTGTTFRDATTQRLDQVQQFLYADQPDMQAKLRTLIDLAQPTTVSAN